MSETGASCPFSFRSRTSAVHPSTTDVNRKDRPVADFRRQRRNVRCSRFRDGGECFSDMREAPRQFSNLPFAQVLGA